MRVTPIDASAPGLSKPDRSLKNNEDDDTMPPGKTSQTKHFDLVQPEPWVDQLSVPISRDTGGKTNLMS